MNNAPAPAPVRPGLARRSVTVMSVLASLATMLAVFGAGAPAHAGVSNLKYCDPGYACLWVDTDWNGAMWKGTFNNTSLPSGIDRKASSSYNNGRSCNAHFTSDMSYQGDVFDEGIGSYRQNLLLNPRPSGGNWNDVIRSLYWCSKF